MAPLARCLAALLLAAPAVANPPPLASLLKQEAKAEQARRSGFEEWCKGELAAQIGRRDEMKHLHERVAPMIGDGSQVKTMSQETSKLAGLLDQREAAAIKSTSLQSRANITLANLQRDVHTLTKVRSKLEHGASFLQSKHGPLQAVSKLLQTAETDQHTVMEKILEPFKFKSEAEHFRSQYERKTAKLTQLRTHQLAATSSRDLLFSALQDENMFLADLQDICSVGKDVYTRYEETVQPALEKIAQEVSVTSTQPPTTTPAPTTTRPPTTTQPPTTTPSPATTLPPTTTPPTTPPATTTPPPPATKQARPPQTPKHHHKHTTQQPATTTAPPTSDDDDGSPTTAMPKKHHHHKTTTTAPTDGWSGDDDDAAPVPKPIHHKAPVATTTTAPAAPATSDDDDVSAPAPKPVSKHKHAAKTTTADPLAGIDPDDDDMPASAPKITAKAKVAAADSSDDDDAGLPATPPKKQVKTTEKAATKKQDFLVDMYASAAGRIPSQYSAWAPGSNDNEDVQGTAKAASASAVDSFKKALDDDDDDAPPPPPHKHATAAPASDDSDDAAAPSPPGDPDAGWKSQMKTKKTKKHHFKDDSENVLSIIQTPHTYSAWTPNHNDKQLKASANNELAAAEAAFDSDDFLQLRSQEHRAKDTSPPLRSKVGGLIQAAVEEGEKEDNDGLNEDAPAMFLERSSTTVETGALDATSLLLEQYGTALGSQPLLQLARSTLSVVKLKNLWHKVQSVDTHSLHDARSKKEAVWCRDFQRTADAQAQKSRTAEREASEELLQIESQHTVLQQEAAAADQILRMLDAGTKQMRQLQDRVQHQFDSTAQVLAEADHEASAASKTIVKSIGQLQGDVETSNAEFVDIVGTVLSRRTTAEEARKENVAQLHSQMAILEQQKAALAKESAAQEVSKSNGQGLRDHYHEMCAWVLADEDDRESREACEKDAIHAALVVLQTR